MKVLKHLKRINVVSKRGIITTLLAAITYLAGCSTIQNREYESKNYFGRVLESTAASVGFEYTSMNIDIPTAYGNIPTHPDDSGKTRKVNLKSGSYGSANLGIDISPLPYDLVENLRLGYTGVLTDTANDIRKGLSDMEWYEDGVDYAGTYSRVELPKIVHSLRASWRQPISLGDLGLFVEPGVSYDIWKVKVQGGWDRYYNEQPMLENTVKSKTLNPFIRAGIILTDINKRSQGLSLGALCFFWKSERIEGTTPYGDIDVRGNTYGLELIINF